MEIKKTFVIFAALIFISAVSAQLTINPEQFEQEIVSGDDITQEISLEWTGSTTTVAELKLDVYNSENTVVTQGFEPRFVDERIILEPDTEKTIQTTTETSTALKPDQYSLEISAETEIEQETTTSTSTVTIPRHEEFEELESELNNTEEKLNQTLEELSEEKDDDFVEGNLTVEDLWNSIDELVEDKESIAEERNQTLEENQELLESLQREEERSESLRNLVFALSFLSAVLFSYLVSVAYRKEDSVLEDLPNPS